jgi:hypothetical protein
MCARAANSAGGGKTRCSLSVDSMFVVEVDMIGKIAPRKTALADAAALRSELSASEALVYHRNARCHNKRARRAATKSV